MKICQWGKLIFSLARTIETSIKLYQLKNLKLDQISS